MMFSSDSTRGTCKDSLGCWVLRNSSAVGLSFPVGLSPLILFQGQVAWAKHSFVLLSAYEVLVPSG